MKRARDEPAFADDGLDFQQLLASASVSVRGKGGARSPTKEIPPRRRATPPAKQAFSFGRRNRAGTDRGTSIEFLDEHQNPSDLIASGKTAAGFGAGGEGPE